MIFLPRSIFYPTLKFKPYMVVTSLPTMHGKQRVNTVIQTFAAATQKCENGNFKNIEGNITVTLFQIYNHHLC